jgi:hypothetical protein
VTFPLADWFDLNQPSFHDVPETPTPNFPMKRMYEYIMADSRGCDVYVGFMSRHEGEALNVYVSHIRACRIRVISDLNQDEAINVTDASLFTAGLAANDPIADVNRDGFINAADTALFFESYACGCNP